MSNSDESRATPDQIPLTSSQLDDRPDWASPDSSAQEEDRKWGQLEETKLKNDTNWLTMYGWSILLITIAFTALFLAALVAWSWHYLTPNCWHWLDPDQLSKIQSVLFSGGMGAVVSGIIRSQLGKAE